MREPNLSQNVRHTPISVATIMKYIEKLTKKVEQKIGRLLLNKFALIFNGWTKGDTHYLGIFATYPFKSEKGMIRYSWP